MAMAKDAFYFSHDSNARNDENIVSLRMDMGWEGYGLYWAVVEMLRDSETYEMALDYKRIAFALQTMPEQIEKVISDYQLFEIENNFFWSNSLKRRMELREKVSSERKKAAKKRWDKAKAMQLDNKSNAVAMQGKERKEKGKERERENYSPEFQEFWKLYPSRNGKKTGKREAFEEYNKALKKTDPKTISSAVVAQSKTNDWKKENGSFVPDAFRWLKKGRWEDEVSLENQTSVRPGRELPRL